MGSFISAWFWLQWRLTAAHSARGPFCTDDCTSSLTHWRGPPRRLVLMDTCGPHAPLIVYAHEMPESAFRRPTNITLPFTRRCKWLSILFTCNNPMLQRMLLFLWFLLLPSLHVTRDIFRNLRSCSLRLYAICIMKVMNGKQANP